MAGGSPINPNTIADRKQEVAYGRARQKLVQENAQESPSIVQNQEKIKLSKTGEGGIEGTSLDSVLDVVQFSEGCNMDRSVHRKGKGTLQLIARKLTP